MQAVRSKGSKIENALGKALWARGFRYRRNNRAVFGKPDFTFKSKKIAIFVDSEFWHGKDWEIRKHDLKSNRDFWHTKIERNIQRDEEVNSKLASDGWIVIRFWGKDITSNLSSCVEKIVELLETGNQKESQDEFTQRHTTKNKE